MKKVHAKWAIDSRISRLFLIAFLGCFAGVTPAVDKSSLDISFKPDSKLPYDVVENPAVIKQMLHSDLIDKIPIDQILKAHQLFDLFSWRTFIALNWPAKENGDPDTSKTMGDKDKGVWRVWNHWRAIDSLFLPNGEAPTPWDRKLYHTKQYATVPNRKNSNYNPNSIVEAFTAPLVDQNGKWVRFDVRLNREEFNYIVKNELYNLDGQVAFSQKEDNNQVDMPLNKGFNQHGAIEIKLAWKELGAGDDEKRFYTTQINVIPAEENPTPKRIKVGLVGMHIAMRTQSAPEWVWSTFEQVDNVRVNINNDGKPTHPNFFNPNLTSVTVNKQPDKNAIIDLDRKLKPATNSTDANSWIESLTTTPVQVQRITVPTQPNLNPYDVKLLEITAKVNEVVQKSLKKQDSVFQYYELIDTQWPLRPNFPAFASGEKSAPESVRYKTQGAMTPTFFINTTMETYFQSEKPQSAGPLEQDDRLTDNKLIDSTQVYGSESCVGCHYSSGIAVAFKKDDQGNEILNDGKPVPIFGVNNHGGKTGGANFSWMLQLEPFAKPRNVQIGAGK